MSTTQYNMPALVKVTRQRLTIVTWAYDVTTKPCRVKSDQASNRIDNLTQITALRVRPKLQSHGSYFHPGDHSLSMTYMVC